MANVIFRFENGDPVMVSTMVGENLLETARKSNVVIDAPCSGNGSCGKCRVKLLGGKLESRQTRHISDAEYAEGWRLACCSQVAGDVEILVPDIASAYRSRMKVADLSSPEEIRIFDDSKEKIEEAGLPMENNIHIVKVKMDPPSLEDTMPDIERLIRALQEATGIQYIRVPYSVLRRLPDVLRSSDFEVQCVISQGKRHVFVYEVSGKDEDLIVGGLAVDIGTTTVSAVVVDMTNGKILAKASAGNGQIRYGAGISPRHIFRLAVAGNSTMNHLLMGINADPLRMEPYIPAFFKTNSFYASDINLNVHPDAHIIMAPNIGSYVGGDITAGTLVSLLWNQPHFSLFIDLGTNGEMVIGSRDGLICTSTAAGPAFEGVNITNGMRATSGAVSGIDDNTGAAKVIGNVSPTGICGSGLIDAVHYFLKTGRICPDGSLADGNLHSLDVAGGVALYDRDIREFQLAKAAVATGFDLLLEKSGISVKDLDAIYVAGGLGNYLDVAKAVQLGLIKADSPAQVIKAGNTALAGCKDLLSGRALEETEAVLPLLSHYSLETDPDFQDRYCENLFFHTK